MGIIQSILGGALQAAGERLSRVAKENLITSILPRAIEEGLSANDSYNAFKEAGLGIRRQDFLAMYRDIEGVEARSQRIKYVRRDLVPSEAVFEPARVPLTARYRLVVEMDAINPNTGLLETMHMAVDTDTLAPIADMEVETQEAFQASDSGAGVEVLDVRMVRGYVNQWD